MEQFFYVLKGEPIPASKLKVGSTPRVWDTTKADKFSWGMQLANQHEGRELFTGPIHLDLFFYLGAPDYPAARKKGHIPGEYVYYAPKISAFLRFLEDSATGVLWNDACVIASVNSQKKYDTSPRTEFFITRLKRGRTA